MMDEKTQFTVDLAGSGQFGTCCHCKKLPSKEGHDGCMGKLPDKWVMNACCGHGEDDRAYVQFWNSRKLIGGEANQYIEINKQPE